MQAEKQLVLADETATANLGAALASVLQPGMVVYLEGDLGAGKTSLARALLRAAGVVGAVKSPTYALVETYPVGGQVFHHFDFYRFESAEEFIEAGMEEYFQSGGMCLVEWPDKAGQFLPPADLRVVLAHDGISAGRMARLSAGSERGLQCLNKLTI